MDAMESNSDTNLAGLGYLCATSIALILALIYLGRETRISRLVNLLPGPRVIPILGNAHLVNVPQRDLARVVLGLCENHMEAGLMRFWIGHRAVVMVFNPEGAEVILRSNKLIDKAEEYEYLHSWLGTGLLTSTGDKWRSRRKMLTPTFHFKILEDFMHVFNQQSYKLISKLEKFENSAEVDIFPFITSCTLDIIHETALGSSINAQDNRESDYVRAVYRIRTLTHLRQLRPWLRPNLLYRLSGYAYEEEQCLKILHSQSYSAIKKRRSHQIEQPTLTNEQLHEDYGAKKKLAFLDLLLSCKEDGQALTEEDIREEVDTFMFEGHDTTSAAIAFTLYLLGWHPEKQELLHQELDAIFGDDIRPADTNDLREMKYLECCIKEGLRLFPPVPMIGRDCTEDIWINGFHIPRGVSIAILVMALHRNPNYFVDPGEFKPERFADTDRHPFVYIPFSAGPRNCIGQKFGMMEEKVVLSWIFRRFRLESCVSEDDFRVAGEIILKPLDGIKMKIHPRNKMA